MIPEAVQEWLVLKQFGEIISQQPVGGGCINNGMVLKTSTGDSFFLKTNPAAPTDMFEREAQGLDAVNVPGGPVIPKPYFYGVDFLLMEDLAPAPRSAHYWEDFGRSLATLHNQRGVQFGFEADNYIGSTPQPNPWTEDGFEFFSQSRLLYLANLASEKRLLSQHDREKVLTLTSRLRSLVPEQPPSLLHGDLWSGNAMTNPHGDPAMIDPAVHYGWAEAELAMTSLFGSFPTRFYHAYEQLHPLEPGYQDRFPIYNLYHLLNHLVLFGRGYLGQVQSILHRIL
jgi:fructosamine-3-kinase